MSLRCTEYYHVQNQVETTTNNCEKQNNSNSIFFSNTPTYYFTVENTEQEPAENNINQSAAIDTVINNLNLNPAARKALEPKAKAIVLYAQNNNLALDQEELVTRLENYAKGSLQIKIFMLFLL